MNLVYVKDYFGVFWTIAVESRGASLSEMFKYAELKVGGGQAIGVKEFYTHIANYSHGEVIKGMEGM